MKPGSPGFFVSVPVAQLGEAGDFHRDAGGISIRLNARQGREACFERLHKDVQAGHFAKRDAEQNASWVHAKDGAVSEMKFVPVAQLGETGVFIKMPVAS